MADQVDTITQVDDGRRLIIRLTNESDGNGETDVKKIDMSALATATHHYLPIRAVDIIRCNGLISGFNYVVLRWDATTDDEILVLGPGSFDFDYREVGPPEESAFRRRYGRYLPDY